METSTKETRDIAAARGFASAEKMREFYERNGWPGSRKSPVRPAASSVSEEERHARDMAIYHQHAPSIRSDILGAELRAARTPRERREAIRKFEETQKGLEARRNFDLWLRGTAVGGTETRAMSESGNAGDLVFEKFVGDVIYQAKECAAFLSAAEHWESADGNETVRPIASSFTAGNAQDEGTAATDGPYPVLGEGQSWPQCPTFTTANSVSWQLQQDAFRLPMPTEDKQRWHNAPHVSHTGSVAYSAPFIDGPENDAYDAYLSKLMGEALGRKLAPVAQSALYAMISGVGATSGGNGGYVALSAADTVTIGGASTSGVTANTASIDVLARLMGALDAAYEGPNTAFYMSKAQVQGLIRQQAGTSGPLQMLPNEELRLWGRPVVVTSQVKDVAASGLSVLYGDLSRALTLRTVRGGVVLIRSNERNAEFAQTYYRFVLRADVAGRDPRAVVAVKSFTA